jgi:hypothetical protein
MQRRIVFLFLFSVFLVLPGCGGSKQTTIQITNKITSLPAGQIYQFMGSAQHDQHMGVTVTLTGEGTLVVDNATSSAYYIAPASVPSPNSVTVTVTAGNGSGVSDSDTFTITPAAGPVVSIAPASFTVSASAGTPQTLTITVTQDASGDTLTPSVNGSSVCGGGTCGSFGSVAGGSGLYTVQYSPPSSVSAATIQVITVNSSLTSSTNGSAIVTINP